MVVARRERPLELVVPGGYRPVAFKAVDPALHRVALLVDLRVEGWWPTADLTFGFAVALLVGLLRNRASNASAAQVSTVGPGAIRLSASTRSGRVRGRPMPTRATRIRPSTTWN